MAKWSVVENTPGYLPEGDPIECDTKQEAYEAAKELAGQLREAGYRVKGNMRNGYFGKRHKNDLGRVIEILPAEEA
jgi:hypothetical protein